MRNGPEVVEPPPPAPEPRARTAAAARTTAPSAEELAAARRANSPARITIAAAGDIMLGTDFPKNHLPDDDG